MTFHDLYLKLQDLTLYSSSEKLLKWMRENNYNLRKELPENLPEEFLNKAISKAKSRLKSILMEFR